MKICFFIDSYEKFIDYFVYFKKLQKGIFLPIEFYLKRTTSYSIKVDFAFIQFAMNNCGYLIDFFLLSENSSYS